jgi:(2R)-ethylmalonyl-CoA mutase
MKQSLVGSNRLRLGEIEAGEKNLVGVNCFTEAEPSPLLESHGFLKVDRGAERVQVVQLNRHRARRNEAEVRRTLDRLLKAAQGNDNILPASIECARSGVTTGEWAFALREVFGEYRAPTGVGAQRFENLDSREFERLRAKVARAGHKVGGRIRLLVAKPGLDGHSNAAEQIALRARDAGFEVIYQGIRQTPEQIVAAARDEDVHLIGLSILSGSHLELLTDIMTRVKKGGLKKVPVVVGGIIREADKPRLKRLGVARVYTPRDYERNRILSEIVDLVSS